MIWVLPIHVERKIYIYLHTKKVCTKFNESDEQYTKLKEGKGVRFEKENLEAETKRGLVEDAWELPIPENCGCLEDQIAIIQKWSWINLFMRFQLVKGHDWDICLKVI